MARLNQTFDPSTVSDDRAAIPAGNYTAQITDSSLEITKAGTGSYIKLQWVLIGGEQSGRVLTQQITYENNNPQAVEIGQRTLKRLCDALGTGPVSDTTDLHLKPCTIVVKVKPERTDPVTGKQYPEGNEISGFKAIDGFRQAGTPAPALPVSATPLPPPRVVANTTRPWAK